MAHIRASLPRHCRVIDLNVIPLQERSLQWELQSPLGTAVASTALGQVQNAPSPVMNLELIIFYLLGVLRVPGFTADQVG